MVQYTFPIFFTLSIALKCLKTVIGDTSNSASTLAFDLLTVLSSTESSPKANLIFRYAL